VHRQRGLGRSRRYALHRRQRHHHRRHPLRRVDPPGQPGHGAFGWQTGLPCAAEGTPSLDSAGVLAAGTYAFGTCPTGAYLIDAATGAILTTLPTGSARVFAQPVFAQDTLFVATETNGLYNFAPNP
jgi:hypothetical protein